ncbi:MAG TPA: leucyl aminopeptidase [Stellaceae bacterium]|nr:leucyl aminopeptidase [Stellaceae bacterium]
MKLSFAAAVPPKTGAVIVGVLEGGELLPSAARLDTEIGGALSRALKSSRFTGKRDEVLALVAPAGTTLSRIVLVGLGKADAVDALALQSIGGTLVAHLNTVGETEAAVLLDELAAIAADQAAANLAFGARLRFYRFDKYRTREKPEQKPSLKKLAVLTDAASAAKKAFQPLDRIADGVFLTRDVVSEPPNVIYPETLAEQAVELASLGLEVEVLDEKKMKKLGMGALLGVGQGSSRPPRLVVMTWQGGRKDEAPVAFIGKGITFDTGGISIKPAAGMEDMKWDMAGSGVVLGLMKALAGRKAKANVVGVVALAENMPDGNAQRPGDIVTSMSGQTIEVLNTDAEGRLVLADALWYTQDRFKPKFMVNLATLTGAIIIALGHEHGGLFSNDDVLSERLTAAGKAVGEPLWRLPLADVYDRDLDSDAADVKNIGSGRGAGSILGAQFLKRFVNDVPWAHLDIAGMAWTKRDAPTVPKGASAFGVRLLDRLVADHYEG